jgi:polar amino acid transport system substrate-binding protein
MRCFGWLALLGALFCSAVMAEELQKNAPPRVTSTDVPSVIVVCTAVDEWPPYTYFKRVNGKKTSEVIGYSVDYLLRVLGRKGIHVKIEPIPWKRCMAEVETGEYAITLDSSINEERARTYLFTKPYYGLNWVYFYDANRPKPYVNVPADLRKLRLCGLSGYNYDALDLGPSGIDTGTHDYSTTFEKLKFNRCDAVPEKVEIAIGYKALGIVDFSAQGIAYARIPWLPTTPFHMMVSRNLPYSQALLKLLNEGITEIEAHDGAADLVEKYGLSEIRKGAIRESSTHKP